MDSKLVCILLCVLYNVQAFPQGPPVDMDGICEDMIPTGHGPSVADTPTPYTLIVEVEGGYEAGQAIQVAIAGLEDGTTHEGFLLEARRQDSSYGSLTEAIGTFTETSVGTSAYDCGGTDTAWGHTDITAKVVSSATWIAPDSDQGPIEFVATIVQGPANMYWENVKSAPLYYKATSYGKKFFQHLKLNKQKLKAMKNPLKLFFEREE